MEDGNRIAAKLVGRRGQARGCSAWATTRSRVSSSPGSRAARHSGSGLKVVWLSGHYQRATLVSRGVLRVYVPWRASEQPPFMLFARR